MKQNATPSALKNSASALLPTTPAPKAGAAEALESMLEGKSVPAEESSLERAVRALTEHLEMIEESIVSLQKDGTGILAEMRRIKMDDHVLTEMHDRCRKLNEQYYQHEVLGPVLLTIIGIADRCRQQTARLREMLDKHSDTGNQAALLAIRQILDARTADRLEIESLLANYGVEPYENPDEAFEASLQRCVSRLECKSVKLHGRICQRLLPGYRRHGKVLRQEYVSVHICTEDKATPNTGATS
jgi:molecular chaperone GrpE (heat shock protein)